MDLDGGGMAVVESDHMRTTTMKLGSPHRTLTRPQPGSQAARRQPVELDKHEMLLSQR